MRTHPASNTRCWPAMAPPLESPARTDDLQWGVEVAVSVLVGVPVTYPERAGRRSHHDAQHELGRSLVLSVAAQVGRGTLNLESGFRS
jgi:hypothetical protein